MESLTFGPVPSRRLGKSIGVNNIPYKFCSYSCAYCQLGKAGKMQVERQEFYSVDRIIREIKEKLKHLNAECTPDYLTIVPDGEPTLDLNLGKLITKLKVFNIPIAVITNSSLLIKNEVRDELGNADYVSLKIDTVNPNTWKLINKPHRALSHDSMLAAIQDFSEFYNGILVSESMLLKDLNDSEGELLQLGQFLQTIRPDKSYIAIPTRPPAFGNIIPADESTVTYAYEVFTYRCLNPELLTGYEGNAFASSGSFVEDILSITAVHPMRSDAVFEFMAKTKTSKNVLMKLIDSQKIKQVRFNNQDFFLRSFEKKGFEHLT
jgi:wyosine [tRNA(Phe)-imidazoG37] synthetase (radical SAM superfamily)